jgi:ankyrin repeat protein
MYATGDQFYSRTPLHLACIHGHTAVVRVLVKRGADVAVLSGFLDKNPLHLACENGHWEAAEILVNKGMDLDVCGNHVSKHLHTSVPTGVALEPVHVNDRLFNPWLTRIRS